MGARKGKGTEGKGREGGGEGRERGAADRPNRARSRRPNRASQTPSPAWEAAGRRTEAQVSGAGEQGRRGTPGTESEGTGNRGGNEWL